MLLVSLLLVVLAYFVFYLIPILLVGIGYSYHRRSWWWGLSALGIAIVMGHLLYSQILESGTESATFHLWNCEFIFGLLFLFLAKYCARRKC